MPTILKGKQHCATQWKHFCITQNSPCLSCSLYRPPVPCSTAHVAEGERMCQLIPCYLVKPTCTLCSGSWTPSDSVQMAWLLPEHCSSFFFSIMLQGKQSDKVLWYAALLWLYIRSWQGLIYFPILILALYEKPSENLANLSLIYLSTLSNLLWGSVALHN